MAHCRRKRWRLASANGSPSSLVATASQDLEAIASYIAADSPAYASIVLKRIVNLSKTLTRFPRAGRKVPEFENENIRELLVYSYRVIYRIEGSEVLIAAIIHGKRDLGT